MLGSLLSLFLLFGGANACNVCLYPLNAALIVAKYTEATVDEMLKQGDTDTDSYKTRLLELRKKVKRDIYAWTKSFVNETQRQPTKQERKDLGGPMFRAYTSVSKPLLRLSLLLCAAPH